MMKATVHKRVLAAAAIAASVGFASRVHTQQGAQPAGAARISAPAGGRPAASWPTDTYFPEEKDIYFNGEAVMLYHEPNAHTDGDSIIFFRKSDVVVAGDTFVTTSYPFIDQASGGSIHGEI